MTSKIDTLDVSAYDEEEFRECVRTVCGVVAAYLVGFTLITKVVVPFLVLGCF